MRVLLIGGTRFVGYQLAWRLLAGGHRLTLLNRGTRPDPFGPRVERLVADRTGPDFAQVLLGREFDAVVDLACFNEADALGAIATLGDRVGHYVQISTGQVYLVRVDAPRPSRETDYDGPTIPEPTDPADRPDWLYGMDKRRAEEALASAWESSRFPSTRLRLPMVHGGLDYYRRLESYLVRLLDGGPVILPEGGGHPTRHVDAGAVVRLIAAILGDPRTFGQAYNLAQNETPTLRELVALMAQLVGSPDRAVSVEASVLRAEGLPPAEISPLSGRWMSFLDPTRARVELSFYHESPEVYLGKIIASYLDHPPTIPPPNYVHRDRELALTRRLGLAAE